MGNQSARADRWSLEALLARVEHRHPSVRAAREESDSYASKQREQQLRWMPFGDFAYTVGGAPKVSCQDPECVATNNVDLRRGSGSLADRSMFGGSSWRVDFGLTQPLFTSGKLEAAALDLGRTATRAGRAFVAREQGDAVLNAIQTYWQLKAARAAVALFEESIAIVRTWMTRIEDALSGDNPLRYTESDAARLKIMLSDVEAAVLAHKRSASAALGALRALCDDPSADVDEAEIALVPAVNDDAGEDSWERALDLARTRRVESRLTGLLVDEGRGWWKLRLAELFPDIAIQSTFGWAETPSVAWPQSVFVGSPHAGGPRFGLGLRQPLDLGPRAARLRASAAERRSREAKREMVRGFVAIDVANAWSSLKEAVARVRETERGEKITRGWFAAVDENLTLGLWTDGRELLEVVQGWVDFRVRKVYAIADANQRAAWLERATGQLRGLGE